MTVTSLLTDDKNKIQISLTYFLKKSCFSILREQYVWVFFKIGLKVCNFIKNRLQGRCVTVNIPKIFRTESFISKRGKRNPQSIATSTRQCFFLNRGKVYFEVKQLFKRGSKVITKSDRMFFSTRFILQFRSSRPEVFSGKGFLKICSKFTGEHSCRSVISINLLCFVCSGWQLLPVILKAFYYSHYYLTLNVPIQDKVKKLS